VSLARGAHGSGPAHASDAHHPQTGGLLRTGLLLAQPARLARHRGADRHRLPGLRPGQPGVRPGGCHRLADLVRGFRRGRVLDGPAPELAAPVARAGWRGGTHDVGHGPVAVAVPDLKHHRPWRLRNPSPSSAPTSPSPTTTGCGTPRAWAACRGTCTAPKWPSWARAWPA